MVWKDRLPSVGTLHSWRVVHRALSQWIWYQQRVNRRVVTTWSKRTQNDRSGRLGTLANEVPFQCKKVGSTVNLTACLPRIRRDAWKKSGWWYQVRQLFRFVAYRSRSYAVLQIHTRDRDSISVTPFRTSHQFVMCRQGYVEAWQSEFAEFGRDATKTC
jgi:hypothetical protein